MTLPHPPLPCADIGVFDSGLGGLSVLREIRRQVPGASVLYLADTANVPYGDKPIAVVRDLALKLTHRLADAGVKIVLMASGTSTVAGLAAARSCCPALPIVGTIAPGAEAAVFGTSGSIGVLATNATAKSRAFTEAVQALDPDRRVIEIGCPQFVPLVETGRADTGEAEAAAQEYLRPLHAAGTQTIILGCTHFPFLLPALQGTRTSSPFLLTPRKPPSGPALSCCRPRSRNTRTAPFPSPHRGILKTSAGSPRSCCVRPLLLSRRSRFSGYTASSHTHNINLSCVFMLSPRDCTPAR